MRGAPLTVAAAFVVCLSACGAGDPQTDEVRENTQPAGYIVGSTSAEARQYFADGMRELDYNRVPEAFANFEQATIIDPNFALAYAYARVAAQNDATGKAFLAKAGELAPNASEYERLIIQALSLQEKDDYAGALALLETLTTKYPDNGRAWETRAIMYRNGAFTKEARAMFEKAIEVDSSAAGVYMWLGESFTQDQPTDFARAEALLKKATALEPNESYVHDLLGDVYRQQGNLEASAAAYTRAAELDPTSGGPLQQRGHVNTFLGRYAEARADYDAAIAVAKGNFKIGFAQYRPFVHLFQGDPNAAIEEMEAIYKSMDGMELGEPDGLRVLLLNDMAQVAAHYRMLDVMDRVQQRRAEVRARRIAAINTDDFRLQESKQAELEAGFDAAYRGNFAKAEQHAEAYRKLRASETAANKLWPYYNLVGTIALLQGRNDAAVAALAQSNPNNIYLTYLSAVAHERAGRKAEAKALYEKITKFNFNPVSLALVRREAEAKVKAL